MGRNRDTEIELDRGEREKELERELERSVNVIYQIQICSKYTNLTHSKY